IDGGYRRSGRVAGRGYRGLRPHRPAPAEKTRREKAEVDQGLRPAEQAGPPPGRGGGGLCGVPYPQQVRDRVRTGLSAEVSEPSLPGRAGESERRRGARVTAGVLCLIGWYVRMNAIPGGAGMNSRVKNLIFWVVVGLAMILLFNLLTFQGQSPDEEVKFSEFVSKVEQGDVREGTIRGNYINCRFT